MKAALEGLVPKLPLTVGLVIAQQPPPVRTTYHAQISRPLDLILSFLPLVHYYLTGTLDLSSLTKVASSIISLLVPTSRRSFLSLLLCISPFTLAMLGSCFFFLPLHLVLRCPEAPLELACLQ